MKLNYKSSVLWSLLSLTLLVSCKTDTPQKAFKEASPKDSIFYGINFNQFEVLRDTIKKNEIKQVCPTCKKCASRTHKLTPNIIKLLKQ